MVLIMCLIEAGVIFLLFGSIDFAMYAYKLQYKSVHPLRWYKIWNEMHHGDVLNRLYAILARFYIFVSNRYCVCVVKQATWNHTNPLNKFPVEKS